MCEKSCTRCLAVTHLENGFSVFVSLVPSRPCLLEGVDGWGRECVFSPVEVDA